MYFSFENYSCLFYLMDDLLNNLRWLLNASMILGSTVFLCAFIFCNFSLGKSLVLLKQYTFAVTNPYAINYNYTWRTCLLLIGCVCHFSFTANTTLFQQTLLPFEIDLSTDWSELKDLDARVHFWTTLFCKNKLTFVLVFKS